MTVGVSLTYIHILIFVMVSCIADLAKIADLPVNLKLNHFAANN